MNYISDDICIRALINPVFLLAIGVIVIILGRVARKFRCIAKNNIWITVSIYLCTFAGIVGLASENRQFVMDIDIRQTSERIELDYRHQLLDQMGNYLSYHSIPFERNSSSPQYFDQLQEERIMFRG